MNFDETYFKSLNYTNYLEREIRYKKMAHELSFYFHQKLKEPYLTYLDFGCAVGFLVMGFRSLGKKCEGYDISVWARKEAEKRGVTYIPFEPKKFDIMLAIDVFEHMTDDDISKALNTFDSKWLLVRIPCSMDGKTFHLEISKKDPTHINCKTKSNWFEFFYSLGYTLFEPVDLYTIYDTDGVMCYLCQKS